MKVIVSSDWHLDCISAGVRRFEELEASVALTVEAATKMRAALYVFAGDLCDPDSGSMVFRCVELAIRTALELERRGIRSAWVVGNHDVIEDGSGDSTLTPMRAVAGGMIQLFDRPRVAMFGHGEKGDVIDFFALPFTPTSHTYNPAIELYDMVSKKTGVHLPALVVGHLNVPGVVAASETAEMPRGRDVWFPYNEANALFEGRRALFINGHYHKAQHVVPKPGTRGVWIPGSLARLSFGEEHHTPGYMVINIDGGA